MDPIQNVPPVVSQPMTPETPHKGGIISLIIKLIVVVVVLAGAVFAYTTFANPFKGKTPAEIFSTVLKKDLNEFVDSGKDREDLKNVEVNLNATIAYKANDPSLPQPLDINLTIPLNLLLEKTDDKEKANVAFNVIGLDLTDVVKATGMPVTDKQVLSFETRMFEKIEKGYFKVLALPSILEMLIGDTSALTNKWFSGDLDNYEATSNASDFSEITDEQWVKIIDAAALHLTETAKPEITIEKVGSSRKVSYHVELFNFMKAMEQLGKDMNEIAGKEIVEVGDMDAYLKLPGAPTEGDMTITFMVGRTMEISDITYNAKSKAMLNGKEIVNAADASFNSKDSGHLNSSVKEDGKVTTDLKSTFFYSENEDGMPQLLLKADVLYDTATIKVDLDFKSSEYTETKIVEPADAVPFESYIQGLY